MSRRVPWPWEPQPPPKEVAPLDYARVVALPASSRPAGRGAPEGELAGYREAKDRSIRELVESGNSPEYAERVVTQAAVRCDRRNR